MCRRDFFQFFCMFYLQCINRKCAIDIQRNTRVASGGQFTSNRLSNDLILMTRFSKARVVQLSPPTPHVPQNLFHGGTFGECDEGRCWWCTSTGKYQCELGTVGTVLDVAVDVVGVVEGAVGGGRGALYQLVCHDCSPAGWNFDISYSPSITKVRVNIFLDFPGIFMWVR